MTDFETPVPPPPPGPAGASPRSGSVWRALGIAAGVLSLILAGLVALSGLGLIAAHTTARDDDGFYSDDLDSLATPTAGVALLVDDLDSDVDPAWILDRLDVTVALEVESIDPEQAIFIGIARQSDIESFLNDVAYEVVEDIDGDELVLERRQGAQAAQAPTSVDFWEAQTSGVGEQRLEWEVQSGSWGAVVMNADGSPGVAGSLTAGIQSSAVLIAGIVLLALGALGVIVSAALITWLVRRSRRATAGVVAAPPVVVSADPSGPIGPEPVRVDAWLDGGLSSWKWLVKWLLAVPHLVVLAVLWVAFSILTVVAGLSILFTRRYPESIFDFNLGVLRWTWRVQCYALSGGLGTDRYPPFTLADVPDYPARLAIERPDELSRGLVLVKWWLLAIPHYLVLAFVAGWSGLMLGDGEDLGWLFGGGLLGVLTAIAGGFMLFTHRYPTRLFDLIVGLNRWGFRVFAYAALMTDRYPPFRLDQGGTEPVVGDETSHPVG